MLLDKDWHSYSIHKYYNSRQRFILFWTIMTLRFFAKQKVVLIYFLFFHSEIQNLKVLFVLGLLSDAKEAVWFQVLSEHHQGVHIFLFVNH